MARAIVTLDLDRFTVPPGGVVTVSGSVIDAATRNGVPYAPVAIYANNAYVVSTSTDVFGRFRQRVTLPRAGLYRFTAYFRGGEY